MLKFLRKARTVPRWIVLFIDLFIASIAFTAACVLIKQIGLVPIDKQEFLMMCEVYLAVTFGVFFLMRIHTGLIRFTNSQDMLRIFIAVLICNVVSGAVYALAFSIKEFTVNKVILLLIINFSIKSSLMIFLRTAVRSMYYYIKYHSSASKKSVLIYATNHNSLLLKQALEASKTGNFYIAGFVEIDNPKINKFIEQRKVYPLAELDRVARRMNVERLIIPDEKLDSQIKQQLIERCLQAGIKISSVPPSDQWFSDESLPRQIKDLKIEDLLSRKPIVINNQKIHGELSGKRILITGAAGSIGSEIMRQVLRFEPAMLILCDQSESPLHDLGLEVEELAPNCTVKLFIADVRNYKRMRAMFKEFRPEIIFHAAAYKHVPLMEDNPAEAIQTNVGGTKNLADLAVYFDADKFVMISTDKAVNPTNIMGASKRIAEIYIQSLNEAITHGRDHLNTVDGLLAAPATANTKFITTRFGNVLGSNGSVIPRFKAQIKKGGPVTVTHPEITRYFMTIPEAVQLVLEAGVTEQGGKIFVFDMGEPVKISDMAKKMIRLAGFTPGAEIEIVYTGLRPGEKLYEELLNNEELTQPTHHEKIKVANVRTYDYKDVVADVEKLLQLVQRDDEEEIVKKMKQMVPEYLSNNSYYQKLDKEPI
ncbi:polysaccharide biosynthesis protein [Mucilaginibacter celer]|uniref:NAD-dependent epimerase/dehydratase family protein n=1 Tax=Mucilaginibacter celer TaxID=2305508 RepID=A0A494W4M2_9SPHI|nr:nucleoside-diphosphate sugar epimerase/dehydratase [Mucilaginibacter celer]AYL98435.1 NAD-dependent epimerase/dehydratase family protein [Mucilaginibacter celer]